MTNDTQHHEMNASRATDSPCDLIVLLHHTKRLIAACQRHIFEQIAA